MRIEIEAEENEGEHKVQLGHSLASIERPCWTALHLLVWENAALSLGEGEPP
jgi:hypothetical protein